MPIGGGPIRPGTLARFTERFASAKFSPKTYIPCYGLAESTLFVTGFSDHSTPLVTRFDAAKLTDGVAEVSTSPDAIELVSCGLAAPLHEVKITLYSSLKWSGVNRQTAHLPQKANLRAKRSALRWLRSTLRNQA